MNALMESLRSIQRSGLGAPLLLMALLTMMVIPLPPLALDLLFTFNIALSLVVILVAVYTPRPLEFAVFPTVLLVATLLRLALNVASTRVILLEGHTGTDAAGNVIGAFGDFVVGGNYAVGLVVFAILVIINFVVVTKGAGRVSEVSARFTLDAMPGKQMAIDADLNSGLISQDEARRRRDEVAQEADFYGSMDGASKFVRGDAIAGILILFINIIGGLIIGTLQHAMSVGDAATNYILLTIGDGLVAQIPSLLLSSATAIIVTRVSTSQDMGQQVLSQLFGAPRALFVAAGIVGALGMVPGMPNMVFLSLATLMATSGYLMMQRSKALEAAEAQEMEAEAPPPSPEMKELTWDDVPPVDLVGLEVGYRLIPLVDRSQGGQLMGRIKGVRRKLSQELGFLIQPVHIRDNLDLGPNHYRITLMGVTVGEGEVFTDREMAINPGQVFGEVKGTPTKDPTFGLDALWIDPAQREEAQGLGYTVVDAGTVVATHLSQILRDHAHELLGHEEVQHLLDTLGKHSPKLVENLVPKTLSLGVVLKVMQNLLAEQIPIRDMRTIAETLAEHGPRSQDPDVLTAAVRVSLSRSIVQNIIGTASELPLLAIDPSLEQILQKSSQGASGAGLGIEPGLAERLQRSIAEASQRQEMSGEPSVLVVSPDIRPWMARWLRSAVRGLNVLAYTEIPDNKQIRVVATVGREET
ncbi:MULTISPECIES: flagellar biosynthesis protein FlhA [Ectothiorhodospira]|uniref:flagellar biosynthesis protein FlhA n=1 Tax=Ectothiorhodospira TaxID=1051 RepID=UPI00046D54A7|nr:MULTISPECIES: flagellar biosynthesis protein FlhA [Ectothiorhodospira]MCG5494051.1 flagellar biosynthesis protein FlhA [Ectothiorhodospira variabilis]MCG5498016.1 flagellar biosynthesis protein FlhA [Ectothiorhodospira variabilis]MCG5503419.1 flagellar biosynthesis protein FlhA [Ectothiorhodospira variabilis]MCG5506493.1 flagellar biosynthesis protein FlhA [Ectothiorhodospira variabilis]MCG5525336.1 flagellar biosynthesis protein FlhA [Ectothiorhodospira haloalkaliphila]